MLVASIMTSLIGANIFFKLVLVDFNVVAEFVFPCQNPSTIDASPAFVHYFMPSSMDMERTVACIGVIAIGTRKSFLFVFAMDVPF